jgi:hypothetical protein
MRFTRIPEEEGKKKQARAEPSVPNDPDAPLAATHQGAGVNTGGTLGFEAIEPASSQPAAPPNAPIL